MENDTSIYFSSHQILKHKQLDIMSKLFKWKQSDIYASFIIYHTFVIWHEMSIYTDIGSKL